MNRRAALPPVEMRPQRWGLFLDLDGTLCPLVDRPEAVDLTDAQRRLLACLSAQLGGALCLVSGRPLRDLQRIARGVPLWLIGAHGAEAPGLPAAADVAGLDELERLRRPLQRLAGEHDGIWLEDKGHAIAMHYRQRPELGDALQRAMDALAGGSDGLRMMHGNRVIELLPRKVSKGEALRRAMQHADFAGRTPVAVGDDVTDEDAFDAAQALQGFGVHVGSRADSIARFRLPGPVVTNTWLAALAGDDWRP